jgi:hypothetical protein
MVIKPWRVGRMRLVRQPLIGLGFCGILLWSFGALPGATGSDPSRLVAEAGQAWQVPRPSVDLGKGLYGDAGAAVCRSAGRSGLDRVETRGVCVRLPADWAVVESERRGVLARYFAGVFWASAETGSGVPRTAP